MGCSARDYAASRLFAMSVGSRVVVTGRGFGVIVLDNEDGTWNVAFDDGTEDDVPAAQLTFSVGSIGDMSTGNTKDASALVIWLHGLSDAPDSWHGIFSSELAPLLPYMQIELPCAPVTQVTCNASKKLPSWFDVKQLPMTLSTPDPGTGQLEAIERVLRLIDDAVAHGIHPSRIVVGGHSQGGAIALAAVLKAAVPVAGCAVFSSWAPPSQNLAECISSSAAVSGGTHFLVCHGDADPKVLPECGKNVASLLHEGGCCYEKTLRCEMFPGMGHGACAEELRVLTDFLGEIVPPQVA